MTRRRFQVLIGLVLPMLLGLSACASNGPALHGRLVIVGGGLQTENAPVFGEFLRDAGEDVIVLPTASGVPLESGPGTVEDLRLYARVGQSVEVVAIEAETPERAFDEEYVQRVERANAAWFTGGVQSRILAVFRPQGVDTPAYHAVSEILERGGTLGGTSAGAAMMCDPMIAWGNSREALLFGICNSAEDRALGMEQGMGFFPFGLVDQHFLRRGRIGRLVVALEQTGVEVGYGIAENSALVVDLESGRGSALGDRAVVMVDLSEARREGLDRRGVRVALLSTGDQLDFRRAQVEVDPTKGPVDTHSTTPGDGQEALGPWDREALSILLTRLSRAPAVPQRAVGESFTLVLRADANTHFYARDDELTDFTAIGVRLDIEANEGATRAAEELSSELTKARVEP